MAKVHILLYRQWDIYFSTESERFIVENGVNEIQKDKPSFAAACAFVDAFIKENLVFEPFKVREISEWKSERRTATIIGIRKDGRFVMENEKGEKSQISEYNEKDWALISDANEIALAEVAKLEAQLEEQSKPLKKEIKQAKSKVKYFTLADQKQAEQYADWIDKKDRNRFGHD